MELPQVTSFTAFIFASAAFAFATRWSARRRVASVCRSISGGSSPEASRSEFNCGQIQLICGANNRRMPCTRSAPAQRPAFKAS